MTYRFITLLVLTVVSPISAEEFDCNGCRVLSKLPEPGIHPRLFFTADEYPRIRERLAQPQFRDYFGRAHQQAIDRVRNQWSEFANADLTRPTDEEIIRYFTSNEGRNLDWGVTSVTAVLNDDEELIVLMKRVIANYARIILASRQRALSEDIDQASNELQDCLRVWRDDRFDVGVSWTFGSSGFAVAYDVLHAHMTDDERTIVRSAIATATQGRKSYGHGMPRGFASSNHYGYHGDLAVLLAAIEGEAGFDSDAYDGIAQVLVDYWDVAFTPFGASREDGYGPNLGLRAGSRGLLVLARRGHNIFATEKYRNFLRYIAMDYDPFPTGHLNGGASGGPYDELYPTSTLIARYMYPRSPVANFNMRHMVGESNERRVRWQGLLDYLLYGADWDGPANREEMLESCDLPLTMLYPVRGKFIARSDWSNDAMYLTFDARPDAHLIGHDKVDRGNFSMSALGRVWAFSGNFHLFNESRENSLVHIDGLAQAWKAPSVRFLWHQDDNGLAVACANLKYAYDWQWSPPWPRWGQRFDDPWEPETHNPLELGWPSQYSNSDLCPDSIHGSETGYAGTNNLHRQVFNSVEKATRSVAMIRGQHNYMLICDDIRKDDSNHRYEWIMQLPVDLEEHSRQDNEMILSESQGDRKLLVRFLQRVDRTVQIESYTAHTDQRRGTVTNGKRLIAEADSVEPGFCVLLFPFRTGESLPATTWNEDRSMLTISLHNQTDQIMISQDDLEGVQLHRAVGSGDR